MNVGNLKSFEPLMLDNKLNEILSSIEDLVTNKEKSLEEDTIIEKRSPNEVLELSSKLNAKGRNQVQQVGSLEKLLKSSFLNFKAKFNKMRII